MATGAARRRIWGWYAFDWASQPFGTLLMTFVFGPYFAEIARARAIADGMTPEAAGAAAQSMWTLGLTVTSLVVALLAPFLGAFADNTGRRLVWVWGFSALYVIGALGLWWVMPDGSNLLWAIAFFGLGFIAMEFATIFTNALLPALAPRQEIGGVSGNGFALGYLGGLVALILMLLLFVESGDSGRTLIGLPPALGLDPAMREGTRAVGPFVAVWYIVFMIPFVLWVKEPPSARRLDVRAAMAGLVRLVSGLLRRRSLAAYLGSSFFYRDALNALYGVGGVYASGVLGWTIVQIGVFGIIGATAAIVASWFGGRVDRRLGPRPVIAFCIAVLIAVCLVLVGLGPRTFWFVPITPAVADAVFIVCGSLIGAAGGALQASSRTMMVRHTTNAEAAEAFGLYALSGRVASFLSPALIFAATSLTGSQSAGIAPLVLVFLVGLLLLRMVNPEGDRAP